MTNIEYHSTRDLGNYKLTTIVSAELRERIRRLTQPGQRFAAIVFSGCWFSVMFQTEEAT